MTQYILLIILIIYFGLHYRLYPFKHRVVNHMESICLFMLKLGLITVIFGFHNQYPEIVSVVMAFIILTPCIMFIICCILVIHFYFIDKRKHNNHDSNITPNNDRRVGSMKLRLTRTQRKFFNPNENNGSNSSYAREFGDNTDRESNYKEENIELSPTRKNSTQTTELKGKNLKKNNNDNDNDNNNNMINKNEFKEDIILKLSDSDLKIIKDSSSDISVDLLETLRVSESHQL